MRTEKRRYKCEGCGAVRPCFVETNQEPSQISIPMEDLKCILDETNRTGYHWEEVGLERTKVIVQVNFYRETGKWYAEDRVEISAMPWEDGVLKQILKNQKALSSTRDFFIVVNDIPELSNDPNYRMTYARLYDIKKVNKTIDENFSEEFLNET